ncbi:uncharacterized protein [Amphiura filiformis]|uniref:uncharacterized protein n=1 Tax=Amphiura filiformis TaxID=82378 RepID=UPI003B21D93A
MHIIKLQVVICFVILLDFITTVTTNNDRSNEEESKPAQATNGVLHKLLSVKQKATNREIISEVFDANGEISHDDKVANPSSLTNGLLHRLLTIAQRKPYTNSITAVYSSAGNMTNQSQNYLKRLSKEESCEDSPENGKCRGRRKFGNKGGKVGREKNDGHNGENTGGGNGGETNVDAETTEGSSVPTTQCVLVITRPSLPEIPAQIQAMPKRLLSFIGLSSWLEDDSSDPPFFSISCDPEIVTPIPEKRGGKDDKGLGVTEQTHLSPTICVSDDNKKELVTRHSLPEIPAMLVDTYKRVLRAVGIDSGNVQSINLPRCTPTVLPKTPDGNDDDDNNDAVDGDRREFDEHEGINNEFVTESPENSVSLSTGCIPYDDDAEFLATRPSLPEMPAVLQDRHRVLRAVGLKPFLKSERSHTKETRILPRCRSNVVTGEPITKVVGHVGGDDNERRRGQVEDNDVVEDHEGQHSEVVTAVSDNDASMSVDCLPDADWDPSATRPSLPEVPAELRQIYHKILGVSVQSKTKVHLKRKKQSRCVYTYTTQKPMNKNGDEADDPNEDKGWENSNVNESGTYDENDAQISKPTPSSHNTRMTTSTRGDSGTMVTSFLDGSPSDDISHAPDYLPEIPAVLRRKPFLLRSIRNFRKSR